MKDIMDDTNNNYAPMINIERMDKALSSKRYIIPNGLSRDAIIKFILSSAKKDKKE